MDVLFRHERVGAHSVERADAVFVRQIEKYGKYPVERLGFQKVDVVVDRGTGESLLIEFAIAENLLDFPVVGGQVGQLVVVEVASESQGREDENFPAVHAACALARVGAGIQVALDFFEDFPQPFGLVDIQILQGHQDWQQLVTRKNIEFDFAYGLDEKTRLRGEFIAAHLASFVPNVYWLFQAQPLICPENLAFP
jgi:hypothetical protein